MSVTRQRPPPPPEEWGDGRKGPPSPAVVIFIGVCVALVTGVIGGVAAALRSCTGAFDAESSNWICGHGIRGALSGIEIALVAVCVLAPLAGAVATARGGGGRWLGIGVAVSVSALAVILLLATGQEPTLS